MKSLFSATPTQPKCFGEKDPSFTRQLEELATFNATATTNLDAGKALHTATDANGCFKKQ
jgi:hypothetical protein